jgi:hypothetical protein
MKAGDEINYELRITNHEFMDWNCELDAYAESR